MNLKKIIGGGLVVGGLIIALNGFSKGNNEIDMGNSIKSNYGAEPNPFAVAKSNQLYEILEKAKGEVLPLPLSLIYGNERINILVEDINSKFFIEIKEGKVVEISNAIREDYTLDVKVKNTYTIFSIINSRDKIRQFNKARSDKDIIINPRGLLDNAKLFFTQFY